MNLPGLALRYLASFALVASTFNPTGYSFFHWAHATLPKVNGLLALAAMTLLIAWFALVRATFRSIGLFGVLLALAFCGALVWVGVDYGLVNLNDSKALVWIALFVVAVVLGTGMSWALVRRKVTGQSDAPAADAG